MVTIPAGEYEALQELRELARLSQATVAQLQAQIADLQGQLAWCKRQIFGPKSERVVDLPGDLPLLPGLDVESSAPAETPVVVPGHKRRQIKRKGSRGVVIPDDLERVRRVIEVPEAERTLPDGTVMVPIGQDVSTKLAFREREYYALEIVRIKYAHPRDASLGVLQEPMPPSIVEGSKFDVSFMAHVVVEKFAYHMPLYRIHEKLGQRGIGAPRQTLSQLLRTLGERVLPLFYLMVERLLAGGCIFTDDTPIKLQSPKKCREARIWIYVNALPNAPPYHVYEFTEDRGHRHPKAFLAEFEGTLHADAFRAYEDLDADADTPIVWAACWAHARRKFENAQAADAPLRGWMLRQMRRLFLYERVAWRRDADARLAIRQEREKPIVDAIYDRLRAEVAAGDLLPKSKLAEAIGYLLKRETNFRRYLDDANLHLDNNTAERGIRKLTIGRKNWMFIGSPAAGESMAALLSLVQTCRAMDINPQAYLEDVFLRLLDHPAKRLEEFLPDRWQQLRLEAAE